MGEGGGAAYWSRGGGWGNEVCNDMKGGSPRGVFSISCKSSKHHSNLAVSL